MISARATLRGRVAVDPTPPARLAGGVAGERATLSGSVSTALATAEAGPSTLYGLEIWLGDAWVPSSDLRGPVEISEELDSLPITWSFGVAGRRYGAQLSERAWTRTPVELWVTAGPAGGGLKTWPRVTGYVISCEESGDIEPVLKVSCGNPAALWDRVELCYELPPGAGLTRGAIVRDVCLGIGLDVDCPDGSIYAKPLVLDGKRLFDWLREFGEPEGWHWRFTPSGALEAYTADVQARPLVPDWSWNLSRVQTIQSRPPGDVPNRWVIKGTRVAYVDETGLKTTIETSTVQGLAAPKAAVFHQLTDGSLVASGVTQAGQALITVTKLEDITKERAGRLVQHTTREWGWYNPPAAKLRTGDEGDGPGPADGYWYTEAWVDADGNYGMWPRERFVLVGDRREIPTWDGDTQTSTRTEIRRWYQRTMGVKSIGASAPHVIGVGVGEDDQSYLVTNALPAPMRQLAEFGLAEVQETAQTFDPATGASQREVLSQWTWVSPRVAIQSNPGWMLADGTAQKQLIAPWMLRERKTTTHLVRSGTLAGQIVVTEALAAPRNVAGAYDWGDFRSNSLSESFRKTRIETKRYRVINEGLYEATTGNGETTLVAGRAPVARYQGSAWTSLRQQPLEVRIDDATLAAWFGPATEAISNDYIQTLEEARAVLDRRRRRRLAHTHEVTASRQPVRCGDTVALDLSSRGMVGARCLVTKIRETWLLAPVTQVTGSYSLEQPLQ